MYKTFRTLLLGLMITHLIGVFFAYAENKEALTYFCAIVSQFYFILYLSLKENANTTK